LVSAGPFTCTGIVDFSNYSELEVLVHISGAANKTFT